MHAVRRTGGHEPGRRPDADVPEAPGPVGDTAARLARPEAEGEGVMLRSHDHPQYHKPASQVYDEKVGNWRQRRRL
jgi:hypothetical protein